MDGEDEGVLLGLTVGSVGYEVGAIYVCMYVEHILRFFCVFFNTNRSLCVFGFPVLCTQCLC